MKYDVAVVGGGASGLSAACALAARGLKVALLEKRRAPGGKAFSFRDPKTGCEVDNGQHIFLGCCTELIAFLRRIGAEDRYRLQGKVEIPFIDKGGRRALLAGSGWLPAPLHMLGSFLRFPLFSWKERRQIVYGLARIGRLDAGSGAALERTTLEAFLQGIGQDDRTIRRFWNLIAVSACNEEASRLSADLGVKVFREGLMGGRDSACFGLPTAGLSDLLARPAALWFGSRGGTLAAGLRAASLEWSEGRVSAVRAADGSRWEADAFVLALAWDDLLALLPAEHRDGPFFGRARRLGASPIVGVHLWYDRPVLDVPFAGVLDGPVHWLFDKEGGRRISVIVSGARRWVDLPQAAILDEVVRELAALLPGAREASLENAFVVKEKKATFSAVPGSRDSRLPTRTPVSNLYLAGAWTDTGWPATLEGAVRSGKTAADAVVADRHER